MQHSLFKPQTLEEGKHGVVGDCNGIPMADRYAQETPMFAKKILSLIKDLHAPSILDYGCGVGRISKELFKQAQFARVVGVDASAEMRDLAVKNVNHSNFNADAPEEVDAVCFDVAVLVYVLQHIPAIEIREALQRIHYLLKDDGFLFYCSSDYRMAIRHDEGGFFDDRFLGVNLREELSRYFDLVSPAFTNQELDANPIVKKMVDGVDGGLAHPAMIYQKKKISGPLFNTTSDIEEYGPGEDRVSNSVLEVNKKGKPDKEPQKLVLVQKQSPGDIMMATIALRDLHAMYPGEYITDMRTPCQEIFQNNPYVTPIEGYSTEQSIIDILKSDPNRLPIKGTVNGKNEIIYCNLHYPMIHESGARGTHFADAMTEFLSKQLGRQIKRTGLRPELYLDQNEALWPSPVIAEHGYDGKYWVINAGTKSDYTLKQYPYYQEVVNLLPEIKFVQIGHLDHTHPPLKNVIDLRGKTDLRQLFRLIYHAEGVLTCVSLPMHATAALKKPCVVIAGGREGTRWELYPDHQFLYVNGTLDCCVYDGCWKSKLEECAHLENKVPLCMDLIPPETVTLSILRYYKGGILK